MPVYTLVDRKTDKTVFAHVKLYMVKDCCDRLLASEKTHYIVIFHWNGKSHRIDTWQDNLYTKGKIRC